MAGWTPRRWRRRRADNADRHGDRLSCGSAGAAAALPLRIFRRRAFAGQTAAANLADLAAVRLRQTVLRDVATVDTATRLFGTDLALPLILGPVGLAGMAARRGEVQAARAAAGAGIPFTLSATSICPLDEVGQAAPCWFQLYMVRDRDFAVEMLARAAAQGCGALVLTVDLPVTGIRWRDRRSGLADPGLAGRLRRLAQALGRPRWLADVGLAGRPHALGNIATMLGPAAGMAECIAWTAANMDAGITWRDVEWVRARWDGPLIVKGIMEAGDAQAARSAGADGIVVSNHGGRQLDGVGSTARALPRIADALGGGLPLFVDGGVRNGVDLFRMLALGADAVLVGRPWLYALAAAGEAGVARMIGMMAEELRVVMALGGVTGVGQIGRHLIDGWRHAPPG